jgi:multidrug resistance efflux pump
MPILDHEAPTDMFLENASAHWFFRNCSRHWLRSLLSWCWHLLFLPWQQFITRTGKVVAFDPKERSLVVEAPLSGRVDSIYVLEGQKVSKDDLLFQVVDNDPNLMENLLRQKKS